MESNSAVLHGSCACERNQYAITVPLALSSMAQVFFDNSAANRRSQAAPVTAWLRIPLDWFDSTTYALMPDETHTSIRRTYYALPLVSSDSAAVSPQEPPPPTRRQFCGYCGTHLTAWNEGPESGAADLLDVTLGSLESKSMDLLSQLDIMSDGEEDEAEGDTARTSDSAQDSTARGTEDEGPNLVMGGTVDDDTHIPMITSKASTASEGLVKGGTIDDEGHIPTNETRRGGADGPPQSSNEPDTRLAARKNSVNAMRHRGIPYFEEMVENSRLGQIRRRKGGYTSDDGRISHEWEIVEIDDTNEDNTIMTDAVDHTVESTASNKRQKTRP